MRSEGRVVLITGAASERGQGAAEARQLVREGAHVVLGDIDDEAGRHRVEELGSSATYHHLDVSDETSWARVMDVIERDLGRLDGLVNNAGTWSGTGLLDTDPDEYRRVVGINQLGVFLGMRAAVPWMLAAGEGSIVNVGSAAALRAAHPHWAPEANAFAYAASKWAVRGMTRSAAFELAAHGVRVNAVHPGIIDTPMITGGQDRLAGTVPAGRLGTPEEVAEVVCFLISGASSYVSGAELTVDGAFNA